MAINLRYEKTQEKEPGTETLIVKITGRKEGEPPEAKSVVATYVPSTPSGRTFATHSVLTKLREMYPDEGL